MREDSNKAEDVATENPAKVPVRMVTLRPIIASSRDEFECTPPMTGRA